MNTNPSSEKKKFPIRRRAGSKRMNISLFVALALSVLLCGAFVFSYIKIYKTVREDLVNNTEDKITMISENTSAFLQTAKTVVATDAGTIEYIIKDGGSNGDILDYLLYQTDFELAKIDASFTGVYGFYRGEYLDGNRWDPYADGGTYDPTVRPWYTAAIAGKGEVSVATPYLDMDTGNIVLSVTKVLNDGVSVVGMDISLSNLSDYVSEYLAENDFGYAYIIDRTGTVVASKDRSEIGQNYFHADADKDTLGVADMFRKSFLNDEAFEYELNGSTHLVFTRTIENGWQVIAAADEHSVFSGLYIVAALCIALLLAMVGILLFFAFSSVRENRIRLVAQKNEREYVTELQNAADKLSSYKRAVLSDALISLEVNLTKDELYYGVWKNDAGKEVPLKEIVGFSAPCSYDEYIKVWNERFVLHYDQKTFEGSTDREKLLEIFSEGKKEVTFDYEAKTISGRNTWLRRSITMTRNSDGDIIAYTSVKDVSAVVNQSKREESYVRALATEYDSICVVHLGASRKEDRVILHSRIAKELSDMLDKATVKEECYGDKMDRFLHYVHHDDREAFMKETERAHVIGLLENDRSHNVTFRFVSGGNESGIYYQMCYIPLKEEDGSLVGAIACLRNVNDEVSKDREIRHELEKARIAAEAASEAKSTFLFNMSHDIRTPMNAIIGFTDIAEKHIEDENRVKDSLGKVKMASEHLLTLINDVLDMSRVESGHVKIVEEPVMIDVVKEELYNILAGSAESKNITLTSKLENIEHNWIYADRLHLMRVLTNVVSNSVKYTNPGGKIELTSEELPCNMEGHALIRYTVTDTGIGMSREFLKKIFEPFSRAESATKSGVVGTGLGMSITKSLVELMGGKIEIESEQGVGTTVRIEILHRVADPVLPTEQTDEKETLKLIGMKILLVEDNELNREIATEILKEEGVAVDFAEDGDIALEKMRHAEENQYDLILMDIQMPRMNGYEATRAIRALPDPYASLIPIIAMTANAFDEDKQNALDAGMNDHVAKPIDVKKLVAAIEKIMGK